VDPREFSFGSGDILCPLAWRKTAVEANSWPSPAEAVILLPIGIVRQRGTIVVYTRALQPVRREEAPRVRGTAMKAQVALAATLILGIEARGLSADEAEQRASAAVEALAARFSATKRHPGGR